MECRLNDMNPPADGDVLTEAPSDIGFSFSFSFSFSKDIRLTRVEMFHKNGEAVQLDLGERITFSRKFVLPLQEVDGGGYRIEWRGLGADGHVMKGMFTFRVE